MTDDDPSLAICWDVKIIQCGSQGVFVAFLLANLDLFRLKSFLGSSSSDILETWPVHLSCVK